MDVIQYAIEILAPGDGHGSGADGIFQHQVPADDPRHQLTHGGVRISVGAAGDRDHRGKLGVAKAGKSAAHARENEGESYRRAGPLGDGVGGAHKETGADDGPDSQRNQRPRSQRPLERRLAAFCPEAIDGFGAKQPT